MVVKISQGSLGIWFRIERLWCLWFFNEIQLIVAACFFKFLLNFSTSNYSIPNPWLGVLIDNWITDFFGTSGIEILLLIFDMLMLKYLTQFFSNNNLHFSKSYRFNVFPSEDYLFHGSFVRNTFLAHIFLYNCNYYMKLHNFSYENSWSWLWNIHFIVQLTLVTIISI